MKIGRQLSVSLVLLTLLVGSIPSAVAQGQIAVERKVRLSPGKSKILRGKTDFSTSYAYKIRADKDRRLEARISSEGGSATFSIVPPGTQTLENGAGVKEWSGTLPVTGEYIIVVAMNTKAEGKFPYTLELTIR
jgi:hypothetical protein